MRQLKTMSLMVGAMLLTACASSSHVVTGEQRVAIAPEEVTVYSQAPELRYEIIGTVSASSSKGLSQQGRLDAAKQELVEEAAKLGANGVIVNGLNDSGGVSTGISTGLSGGSGGFSTGLGTSITIHSADVKGQAIYVYGAGDK